MDRFRFAVGFVAGILDELGMIRARDTVIALVACTGAAIDGFDLVGDIACSIRNRFRA